MTPAEKLFDGITEVGEKYVEAAQNYRFPAAFARKVMRFAPRAAGLILVIGIGVFLASAPRMGCGGSATGGDGSAPGLEDNTAGMDGTDQETTDSGDTSDGTSQPENGAMLPVIVSGSGITLERLSEEVYLLTNTTEETQDVTLRYPEVNILDILIDGESTVYSTEDGSLYVSLTLEAEETVEVQFLPIS